MDNRPFWTYLKDALGIRDALDGLVVAAIATAAAFLAFTLTVIACVAGGHS